MRYCRRRTFALLAAAVAVLAVALATQACERSKGAAAGSGEPAAAASAPAAPAAHVDADHYRVDTKLADCVAGAECTATIRLEATGAYHINDTYPYKFTAASADAGASSAGVEFLGKDASRPAVFDKGSGDFEREGEKVGVLRVRFKAPRGPVAFAGRFKLSVCSEANCELDQADVAFAGTAN